MVDLRTEHPRPDARRAAYFCLNGEWEFAIDNARVGKEKNWQNAPLAGKITVPYCPESVLSGVGNTDYMNAVWYRRSFTLPAEFAGKRIFLRFGAADYKTEVWVNGQSVGTHTGGYTPFSFDITPFLAEGEQTVTVYCEDAVKDGRIPAGKQSERLASFSAFYTRTTGIWQTVWLEATEEGHISAFRLYPDIESPALTALVRTENAIGQTLTLTAFYEGRKVGEASAVVSAEEMPLTLALSEKHLWEVGNGRLYDLTLSLSGGDEIFSYFGLRTVRWTKAGLFINGKAVFGRFVLDQGFYPDGIYTAPSDKRLEQDITDSLLLGFNGARPHQKVFEPRYLYHADRHGYLIFGEYPNWGLDISDYAGLASLLPEWLTEMERDFNHPSLIGWCPLNETWDYAGRKQCDDVLRHLYLVTKAYDATRPCIDTSGFMHVVTDIFDLHDYAQDAEKLKENIRLINERIPGDDFHNGIVARQQYDGKLPLFMSEYGGIGWDAEKDGKGWGYGASVKNEEEFLARYKALTDVFLDSPDFSAFCYTQLYDVEQEKNGLMTYDRRFKFDPAVIRAINTRRAKTEE